MIRPGSAEKGDTAPNDPRKNALPLEERNRFVDSNRKLTWSESSPASEPQRFGSM